MVDISKPQYKVPLKYIKGISFLTKAFQKKKKIFALIFWRTI